MFNGIYNGNIIKVVDILCPVVAVIIPEWKPKWLSNDIISMMRDRDALYIRALRDGKQDDWNIARHLRNRVQSWQWKRRKIKQNLNHYKNNSQF